MYFALLILNDRPSKSRDAEYGDKICSRDELWSGGENGLGVADSATVV